MNELSETAVGFIGLGAMGSQLARHALEAGWTVHVYDVNPRPVTRLATAGAIAEPDVASMTEHCRWLVTSLPRADALFDVAEQVASGRGQVRTVIEASTFSVAEKQCAAAMLAHAKVGLVDSPLSGTSRQAIERDLVAYISGSDEDCAAAQPIVATFTRAQYQLGQFGNGTRMKLVANLLVAIHNVAAAEALVLAARVGLDLDTVLQAVGDGAGHSRMLQVRGPLMTRGDFTATMRVDNFIKDVDIIEAQARSVGVTVPLLHESARLYRQLLQEDLGHLDTAAVYGLLLRRAQESEQPDQA